ncbi:signal recognition particle-docking protein FtsY [bacterium]|nr:MAG: signal recognition particle-docking protein FtsY [bacterium]
MTTEADKSRYTKGLEKSRGSIMGRIRSVFGGREAIAPEDLEDIEDILIQADVGVTYTTRMIEDLQKESDRADRWSEEGLKSFLAQWISNAVGGVSTKHAGGSAAELDKNDTVPHVILIIGVNGTGKTTSIGKLSNIFRHQGKKVMVVAGDTYRAAAAEQLEVWAQRSGALYHRGQDGSDPAAVVHDALNKALAKDVNTVLVDTAGRLHTKEPLMKELGKISTVASKVIHGAPHEVILVLDATTGQNALIQSRTFTETVGVTGIILTKMDGSARGGILVPIAGELGLPVKYVGMGEGIEDLVPFDPQAYAEGLVG